MPSVMRSPVLSAWPKMSRGDSFGVLLAHGGQCALTRRDIPRIFHAGSQQG